MIAGANWSSRWCPGRSIILAFGVAIAAVILWREADRAFALVIVWAYVGIAAKQDAMAVIAAAIAGAVVVAVLIAYVLVRARRPATVGTDTA